MSIKVKHEESSWENDPVWDLLDKVERADVDPLFVSNVMREVRLANEVKGSWWKYSTTFRPLLAGSSAILVAVLFIAFSGDEPSSPNAGVDSLPPQGELEAPHLDTLLDEEMLSQAAENPAAFSDEALVALLSQ
ncbi:MAG TPA: hypothetical protein DD438_01490 [Verrucomicrobiales bacterium]|nr:hypothetical protein [Verrucomicrobiales bacterium]